MMPFKEARRICLILLLASIEATYVVASKDRRLLRRQVGHDRLNYDVDRLIQSSYDGNHSLRIATSQFR